MSSDDGSAPAWSGVLDDVPGGEDSPAPGAAGERERYSAVGVLGTGGMGRVALARDERLGREVAIKELRASLKRTDQTVARFLREARITARLEHPAIVPIYDAGISESGEPWYAMRRIRGQSLEQAVADAPDRAARLGLLRRFLAACEGLAYAHNAGVVHRDLKPANIMLGNFGETLVVDWGLARPLDEAEDEPAVAEEPGDEGLTRAGAVLGTPAWMSPEQAHGRPVDRRSDVWSLGATLYFVLEGSSPVGGEGRDALTDARDNRRRAFSADVPPELAALCDRAMATRPEDRYPDAAAFAGELLQWLDGRRVDAYKYTAWELLRRLVKRWRVPLLVAGVALAVLAVVSSALLLQIRAEAHRARSAEAGTRTALDNAQGRLGELSAQSALAAQRRYDRPEAERMALLAIENGEESIGRGVLMGFGATPAPARLGQVRLPTCPHRQVAPDGSALVCMDGKTTSLYAPADSTEPLWSVPIAARTASFLTTPNRVSLTGHDREKFLLVDGATGKTLGEGEHWASPRLMAGDGVLGSAFINEVKTWDSSGAMLLRHMPCDGTQMRGGVLTRAGIWRVLCPGAGRNSVEMLGGPATQPPSHIAHIDLGEHGALPYLLVESPNGARLAALSPEGHIWILDSRDGTLLSSGNSHTGHVTTASWGALLAVSGDRGGASLYDPDTGQVVWRLPQGAGPAFLAAGQPHALVTLGEQTMTRWRLPSERPVSEIRACPASGVVSVVPAPTGDGVVTTCGNGRVQWMRRATGRLVAGQDLLPAAKHAAFSPDGTRLAAVSSTEYQVFVFDAVTGERLAAPRSRAARRLAWLADGRIVVAAYLEAELLSVDETPPVTVRLPPPFFVDLGAEPGGESVALVSSDGGVWTLNANDAAPTRRFTDPDAVGVDITAHGHVALITTTELRLHRQAASTASWRSHVGGRLLDVAFSRTGRLIAAASANGTARVFDANNGVLRAELRAHTERVASVRFGPDDAWLVTGSWDDTIRFWSLAELETPAAELRKTLEARWGRAL